MDESKFVGYLSNYEIYKYFKEIKERSTGNQERAQALKSNRHLSTVVYETLQYFQNTPCTVQNEEAIAEFVRQMEPFKLTKPEKLNILNTRPTQPVDIQAIVEESEERLSETQIDDIINVVETTLPSFPSDEKVTLLSHEEEEEEISEESS